MKAKIFTEKDPQELEKALNSFLSRENVSEIYSITPIISKKTSGIIVVYLAPPKVWGKWKKRANKLPFSLIKKSTQ